MASHFQNGIGWPCIKQIRGGRPRDVGDGFLTGKRRSQPSGQAMDWQETLALSALTGVAAMVERFELEKANEAYARMLSNQARFCTVLAIG